VEKRGVGVDWVEKEEGAIMIFLTYLVLAAAAIDTDMTREEQKVTGLHKLSKKEKKALQAWISDHYVAQGVPTPRSVKSQTKHPLVEENLQSGRYIRLTDETIWEINPSDVTITQGWLGPTEIIVTQTSDSEYPYVLTNQLSGASVRARRLTRVPLPSAKPQPSQKSQSKP
jgi:hypothetical protein